MKKVLVLCVLFLSCAYSQVYESPGITVVGKRLYDGSLKSGYYGGAQVITSADITAAGAQTVPDVLQKYGIAKYSQATGSSLDGWFLNWNGFSKGEEIVVIVDGIKVNEADDNVVYWPNIPVTDIERIEIISGAGSAQYGSGAFAGILNIVTQKAPRKSVAVEAGSYGYGRQKLALGDTFADNFYYQLDFDNLAGSGQRKQSAYNSQRLSGKLGYFDANSELNLYYKTANSFAKYPQQLLAEEILYDRAQAFRRGARRALDSDQTNLEYIYQLNADWKYALNLGARNRLADFKAVSRGGIVSVTKMTENDVSYLGQLTYKDKITFGYDYRLANIRSRTFGDNFVQLPLSEETADTIATKGEYAPYFQYFDNWKQLYWRYGAREDRTDYVQTNNNNKSDIRRKKAFSRRTHNGEIGWNFVPDWQVYYSYGEAFKAPGFSYLFASYGGNENLSAELAKTQAAGLRWQNALTNFNWQVFQTDVEDEIVWVDSQNENAQKTRRAGFNLNLEQKLQTGLSVFANYNYTKARFLEAAITYPSVVDISGYTLPLAPEQIYSFGARYALGKWSLDFTQNFVDKQYADSDFLNEGALLPAYTFADMRVACQPSTDWNLYLQVHNLFNNIYNTKALLADPAYYYTPADLRTAALGAQWSF